jgi:extracellular elastinolytic metalloproteinase
LSNYNPKLFDPVSPQVAALTFVRSKLNVRDGDFVVTNSYTAKSTNITHVYLQQTIKDIKVANGKIGIHVNAANNIIAYDDSFFKGVSTAQSSTSEPHPAQTTATEQASTHKLITRQLKTWDGQTNGFVSPVDALRTLASHIQQQFDTGKATITSHNNPESGQSYLIRGVDFATEAIRATQSYIQATANELVPVWEYSVKMPLNYFHAHVSADGKKIVYLVDLVRFASYRVNKFGTNNPIDTPRQLVTNPADRLASPNGWHTQGSKKFTTTIGNNIIAQENCAGADD